jgi:16S rRNA processing protein RimM
MTKRPVDFSKKADPVQSSGQSGRDETKAVFAPLPDHYVVVGVVGAPHGLRGEVRVKSHTADPMAIGDYGSVRLQDGRQVEIKPLRHLRDGFIIARLKGIEDRTAAESLTGLNLSLPRDRLPVLDDDDEFYHADLVGLNVVDAAGQVLGKIIGLFNHGAGDMLEIRLNKAAPTDFLPFTKQFVPKVDLKSGIVEVVLPEDFGKAVPPPPMRTGKAGASKAKSKDRTQSKGTDTP